MAQRQGQHDQEKRTTDKPYDERYNRQCHDLQSKCQETYPRKDPQQCKTIEYIRNLR